MSLEASPVSSATSSRLAVSAAGDGDDYDDDELQFVLDTVARAEAALPYLPTSSRHPTNALFRAYEELLEEREVQPLHGPKLDKLLFKIGGSRDGTTIAEKFRAVLAKMNITVRLGIDEATEDGYSYRSDESYHSGDSDDAHHSHDTALEKNAAAFVKHLGRIHSSQGLQEWQERATHLKTVTDLFAEAREADSRANLLDVLVAWNEIAAEVDEMPLNDLSVNVYSKRIERIATRTHEIKSTKNALDAWRHRAAGHRQGHAGKSSQMRQEEEDGLFRDDPKLTKLAQLTHENLSKSRALALWSNRTSEEDEKAEVARQAREMNLKARAFGLRPKPQLFAGLRERLAAATSVQDIPAPAHIDPKESDNMSQAPEYTVQHETGQLNKLASLQQSSSGQPKKPPPSRGATAGNEDDPNSFHQANLEHSAKLAASQNATCRLSDKLAAPPEINAGQVDVIDFAQRPTLVQQTDLADELDERTLLAKRHMTRFRVFNAWEDYTKEHKFKVEAFASRKVVEPWRQRSSAITNMGIISSHEGDRQKNRNVVVKWKYIERQRRLEAEAQALKFEETRHLSALEDWNTAAHEAKAREQQLEQVAIAQDGQLRMHELVQIWKARGRERAVHASMKSHGLSVWRTNSEEGQRRGEQLQRVTGLVALYRIKQNVLPPWQEAAQEAAAKEQQLQTYCERADFYSLTTTAISTWRNATKVRRKARLREAYLETRRRVKKAAGARSITQWRDVSATRHEGIAIAHEEHVNYRDWNAEVQNIDVWRVRAAEKAGAESAREAQAAQKYVEGWRARHEGRRQLHDEAEEYFEAKAVSRTVKEWKLSSLQLESRRNASEKHLNRGRKQLKQGISIWHAKAIDKAQRAPVIEEETEFPSTPGRPRLLVGGLRPSTTPLAPIPQRQTWQGAGGVGGPADSLLGLSLPGGTSSRSARPRRNLRVSWADR